MYKQPAVKPEAVQAKLDHAQRPQVYVTMDEEMHRKEKSLQKLIENQLDYVPAYKALSRLQKEVSPDLRRVAIQWLQGVCDQENCNVILFPLTVNFMDRYMAKKFIPKTHLQALAATCLLLAGKVKSPVPLSAATISSYTDGNVPVAKILEWELDITATLAWEFYAPTLFEFYDQILSRWTIFSDLRESFQRSCNRLFLDEKLSCLPPSKQAAYCLGFAACDVQDKDMYLSIYCVITDLFGISKEDFIKDVSTLATLMTKKPPQTPTTSPHRRTFHYSF